MEKIRKILIISSDENLKEVLQFCFDGWGYEVFLWDTAVSNINPIKRMSPDVIVVDVHTARRVDLEICRLLKDDFITASIPIITLIDKRQLRSQLLNIRQGVDDYLIKPPDPLDLRVRIEMAIRRAQHSFNTSPLTGLPGTRLIEETLKDKLKLKEYFSFGYVDIDNFKYFNDVYGYLKGDRVIMQTAYILYTTIEKLGNSQDFIGHIGGDDFVFLTTPDKCNEIAQNFIYMFNKVIPFHYSIQDRNQMFIIAKDRTHRMRRIPLMSVSVAIVSKDSKSQFKNIIQINERVTEIKRYLKSLPGSKFMAERRDRNIDGFLSPSVYKRQKSMVEAYMPLGQILVKNNILTSEQLDEALRIHWKRGIIIGEVLRELKLVSEEQLRQALTIQQSIPKN